MSIVVTACTAKASLARLHAIRSYRKLSRSRKPSLHPSAQQLQRPFPLRARPQKYLSLSTRSSLSVCPVETMEAAVRVCRPARKPGSASGLPLAALYSFRSPSGFAGLLASADRGRNHRPRGLPILRARSMVMLLTRGTKTSNIRCRLLQRIPPHLDTKALRKYIHRVSGLTLLGSNRQSLTRAT